MLDRRVEQEGLFVGNLPFGLVEKDAKFARWDTRKSLKQGQESWRIRRANLFESSSNDVLLQKMSELHSMIVGMEEEGLERAQILRNVLAGDANVSSYDFLLQKAPWGKKLKEALQREKYEQDEKGELWSDFVMERIHRAISGTLIKSVRYDDRFSYQITTDKDILYFNPESQACANDGPLISIFGNKVGKEKRFGNFSTDLRFSLILDNISRVEICEMEGGATFIRALPGVELKLSYRQQLIGSIPQINLDPFPIKSKEEFEEDIRNYVKAVRSGFGKRKNV